MSLQGVAKKKSTKKKVAVKKTTDTVPPKMSKGATGKKGKWFDA
jgi:hypothetical protein